MPNQALINLGIAAILAFASAYFFYTRNTAIRKAERLVDQERAKAAAIHDEYLRTKARIEELERQLGLFGQTILPISAAFQAILVKQLTHFHTPVLDGLLKKLGPPYELTDAEAAELARLLEEREVVVDDQIDESEREAARMLPLVMKRVKAEFELLQTAPISLQMVTVAPESLNEPPVVEGDA